MNAVQRVPFLDLVAPHRELRQELCEVFGSVLDSAGFIGGPLVEGFEREFAKFAGVRHCLGVASGTDALRFALIAAGIKNGEIVVTVPNSFIATTEAISQAGGFPDFVDVDEDTYNMDPLKLRYYLEAMCYVDEKTGALINRRLGRRVTAIVPIHLYGQPADMDPIMELANRYNLVVVEDACQAHGAEYYSRKDKVWKKVGSMGVAGAFSFYPGKNLGACGEAGAITTNDPELLAKMRMLREHGQVKKYFHDMEGYNGRLDAVQAGILSVKLRHLPVWNERRRQAAAIYDSLLSEAGMAEITPFTPDWARCVFHLYVVRSDNREALAQELANEKIDTGIHYPMPLHLQAAYRHLGYHSGDFPVSERCSAEILSLPMFPQLTREQQERVIRAVAKFAAAQEMLRASEEPRYMVASA